MKLTDIAVRNLSAPPKASKVYHDDSITGFGVRVTAAGVKAFVLTYGANRERATIGRYPIISLQDARTEAKRILAERTLGKARPPRKSLSDALETYYGTHVANLRPGTQREIKRLFARYLPKRGNLDDLTVPALTKILDGISSPSEAEHFHRAAKTFFKWCVERDLLPTSPIDRLRAPSRWKSRERVLSDDELRAVWRAADTTPGSFGIIVKLLILTGQRRGEIAALKVEWCSGFGRDIDVPTTAGTECRHSSVVERSAAGAGFPATVGEDSGSNPGGGSCTITLPSEITKNKRSHTFPISTLTVGLLRTAILASSLAISILDTSYQSSKMTAPKSSLMFPARGHNDQPFNGWSKAKAQLDKKIADHLQGGVQMAPWTLHDLRRTYATNLQRLGIKLEVIEQLLNHKSGVRSGVVGIYQRFEFTEECRAAVDRYETWIKSVVE